MRYLLGLIVAFTFVSSTFVSSAVSQNTPPPAVTVIRAGVLIDGKSDQPRRDQVIVIRGNRIESVSDARQRENSRRRQHRRSLPRHRASRA